jgi:hypothetical protein
MRGPKFNRLRVLPSDTKRLSGATKHAKVVQNDMSGNCSTAPLRTAALNSGALPIMSSPTVHETSHHQSKKMVTRRKEGKRTDETKQT